MWFIPIISTNGLIKFPLLVRTKLTIFIDQGWTENILGQGIIKILYKYSSFLDVLIYYFNLILRLFILFLII